MGPMGDSIPAVSRGPKADDRFQFFRQFKKLKTAMGYRPDKAINWQVA